MCVPCMHVQSCPTLSNHMDCSLPGSSIPGIFQAKYWSGVPLPSLIYMCSWDKLWTIRNKKTKTPNCHF